MSATNRLTMVGLAEEHLFRRGAKIAPNTLAAERSTVMHFAHWWDRTRRSPKSLTPAEFDDYLYGADGLRLSARGGYVTAASYNTKVSKLRPFIVRLARAGTVSPGLLDDLDDSRQPAASPEHTWLSHGQIQEMVTGAPTEWERWMLALGVFTLGRERELIETRLRHINLEAGLIAWHRPKVRDRDGLPILGELRNEYLQWRAFYLEACPDLNGDSYAIPHRQIVAQGQRWAYDPTRGPSHLGRLVKANVARVLGIQPADLKNEAAHILRRSGARALYDALRDEGVTEPARIVQTMLGHAKQSTTELYIGIRADRERRDELLRGSRLMSWSTSNVVDLGQRRREASGG